MSPSQRTAQRHWRLLMFLGLQGSATTEELAQVVGVRRLTAHRDLTLLQGSGLVRRSRSDQDRTHTWFYRIADAGIAHVSEQLRDGGHAVPLHFGRRHNSAAWLLFMLLVYEAGADPSRRRLYRWLNTLDTAVWLRQHHIAGLRPDGLGVWIEDGLTLRFLVHCDDPPSANSLEPVLAATKVLHAYREASRLPPVEAVLVIAADAEREQAIVDDLTTRPLGVAVATVQQQQLLTEQGASGAIWRYGDGDRRRLIELSSSYTTRSGPESGDAA
ncbi:MarR family transcriptional regulator [Dactylosporangium sp. CA-152071]|uniref:MarR family transcriptional regulator n=1 Tax=Dactylosporangium sp. CA-152071 TaxID=3239933 RepID=UPI003D8A3381